MSNDITLRAAMTANDQPLPTHRCTECGALWRLWDERDTGHEGSWNLRSPTCGPCCDMAPMGKQIVPLTWGDLRAELARLPDPDHDIVPTLRQFDGLLMGKAADEIERLRIKLRQATVVAQPRAVDGASPLPWKLEAIDADPEGGTLDYAVLDAAGNSVIEGVREPDGRLMVNAVNALAASPVAQPDKLADAYRLAANMNVQMPRDVQHTAAFRAGALAMRSAIADAIAAQSEAEHTGGSAATAAQPSVPPEQVLGFLAEVNKSLKDWLNAFTKDRCDCFFEPATVNEWAAQIMEGKPYVPGPGADESHPDDLAVDRFAAAMKEKLAQARAKGRGGWNDPAQCSVETLARMLVEHIAKGDPVDVANFAMMLHQRGAGPELLAAVREASAAGAQFAEHDGQVVFINHGDRDEQHAEHEDLSCPACGGSGHRNDVKPVPDAVWEALQRMIEDGLVKGPASREDALAVARHRDRHLFMRAALAAQQSQRESVAPADDLPAMPPADALDGEGFPLYRPETMLKFARSAQQIARDSERNACAAECDLMAKPFAGSEGSRAAERCARVIRSRGAACGGAA